MVVVYFWYEDGIFWFEKILRMCRFNCLFKEIDFRVEIWWDCFRGFMVFCRVL